jgi:hypothetical protein
MLAKRPEDRWQSMEEVITALTAGATQGQASPAATGDSSSKQVTGVAQSTDRAGGPNAKDKSASSPTPGPVPKKGWFKWFSIGIVFLGPATVGPILTRLI